MSKATPSAAVTASRDPASAFGDGQEIPSNLDVLIDAPLPQGPAPLPKSFKRVWIQLEDNDDIPPTGQFIGCNGRSYMLRPGEPAAVPEEVVEVLQDAVMSVPVMDQNNNVVGYRDRLRLPFRFVAAPRVPVAA